MELEKIIGGEKYTVKVITGDPSDTLTENDKEMDYRARKAVEMAIEKARICKKPIARYDAETKRAYLEKGKMLLYATGHKTYYGLLSVIGVGSLS